MTGRLWPMAVALLLAGMAGCITLDGEGQMTVRVLITRDFGSLVLDAEDAHVPIGATVMDALFDVASVTTAYGGGFVQSINGLESAFPAHREDWFFEVDGQASLVGATDWRLQGGETIHWDFRAWPDDAPTPGLFNTFPWEDSAVRFHNVGTEAVPEPLAGQAQPWEGSWPDGAAVLVTNADGAPWDGIPWVEHDGDVLRYQDQTFDGDWALASRLTPPGTVQAVVVEHGRTPDLPATGAAWIYVEGRTIEVRPQ